MPDKDRVIKGINCLLSPKKCDLRNCYYGAFDKCINEVLIDALELLKDQEDLGTELTNAVELIHKKNERIEKLLKEQKAREKKICKEICDFIRGSCSTDTYEDKEFVCHKIQKCFMEGR